MKSGTVALIGRPNVGKSTLVNQLLGRKVSITSPKPQTTRFPIHAVFEDDRGQIVFVDTPGIFAKVEDTLARTINQETKEALKSEVDLIVYIIDTTRARDAEENKTLGMVRKFDIPKILVVNKTDIKRPDFSADFAFYEDEFDTIIKISGLKRHNLNLLLTAIFDKLPEGKPIVDTKDLVQPALNLDSKLFIGEIIREKVFLFTHEEVPYTVTTQVDSINERDNGTLYIQARIITTADRYKAMLIGKNGSMIKEIGMAVRKELETASGKRIFVDLSVDVNPHWMEAM